MRYDRRLALIVTAVHPFNVPIVCAICGTTKRFSQKQRMRFAKLLLGKEWRIVRCKYCVAAEPIDSRSYFLPRYPMPLAEIID